jgi:hypothetical protein
VKVCFITTGQPSTNPRLVKEADACVEAGWKVHVVAAYWADWATGFDRAILSARNWDYTFVDWSRGTAPALFWKTGIRHRISRALSTAVPSAAVLAAAASRVGPELPAGSCGGGGRPVRRP